MNLYLMRHGLANDVSTDPEQGLSDSGRADVQRLADRLKQKPVTFHQVFHSSKTRTRQTAEIMQQTLSERAAVSPHPHIKPNDNPDMLLQDIHNWRQDTLVVSHLPFLPSLIAELTGHTPADIGFQPATLVCMQGDMNTGWDILWVETP